MVYDKMGMMTVSPAGMTHVALFWASRVQEMSKSTLPDAEMVLPLVQSHRSLGLKLMVAVLVSALLSPTLKVCALSLAHFLDNNKKVSTNDRSIVYLG